MAIFHCAAKIVKRSGGMSAVAAAAYRSCSKIVDERTNITHDYTKKQSLGYSEILSPIPAVGDNAWVIDREKLWNEVEAREKRYDSQLAREIEVGIPVELDRNVGIQLVREYVQENFVSQGMIADVCFHDLDSHNPHAHIMLTMRGLTLDENGVASFGNKQRNWDKRDLRVEQRENWETIANEYLAKAGFEARIDCRSLEDQGIDRIPQIHLGPKVCAMMKRGIDTKRGDRYAAIEAENLKKIRQAQKFSKPERDDLGQNNVIIPVEVLLEDELEKDSDLEVNNEEVKIALNNKIESKPQPQPSRGRSR
jgi:ATP-dependent exoDNAse (exonuclease V) alpha subunit